MDKKALLDKMSMPKKPGMEDDMLEFSEEDMQESPDESAPASAMDLTSVTDDELLAEAKKRGLVPDTEGKAMDEMEVEGDSMESSSEEEEYA
jgi:hypothetical protein